MKNDINFCRKLAYLYIHTLIKWESCWVQNSHVWILQGYAYLHWLMPHSKIWCIGALAFYHCCIKMWSCLLLHWVAKYFTSSTYVSSHFFATNAPFSFATNAPFSFPCFVFHQVFAWSFCSLHLQAMGKRCTNSNSVNGGDLLKGCRGTLGHVQGSPQGHNILFCHTHKAKMPSSQWTRAYRNAMSQSNIKGKQCTNSNSVNGGDLSKGCRGTLGHVQGSPQGCNILFCHAYKANTPLSQQTWTYHNVMSQSKSRRTGAPKRGQIARHANLLGFYRDSREHKDLATLQECLDHLEWTRMLQFMEQICIIF